MQQILILFGANAARITIAVVVLVLVKLSGISDVVSIKEHVVSAVVVMLTLCVATSDEYIHACLHLATQGIRVRTEARARRVELAHTKSPLAVRRVATAEQEHTRV